jgi:uncharacterized protein (TIGR02246 family)
MNTKVDTFALTDDATKVTDVFVRAMNAGDVATVLRLYTPDAVSMWEPEKPISGQAHRDAVTEFMRRKPTMSARVVAGDAALLVVDWTIDMPGAERLTGTGLDVLRRGEDGKWRYAIDNPFGDS